MKLCFLYKTKKSIKQLATKLMKNYKITGIKLSQNKNVQFNLILLYT